MESCLNNVDVKYKKKINHIIGSIGLSFKWFFCLSSGSLGGVVKRRFAKRDFIYSVTILLLQSFSLSSILLFCNFYVYNFQL